MRAPRTLAALIALALPACAADKKADFSPIGVLAVDAYLSVTFRDACRGGGKVSFCGSEAIDDDLSIRIDDPDIARIVPEEEWPEGFVAAPGVVVLQGVWPGTTKIRGRARFSDGSWRSTSTKVSVKRMERLALEVECQPDAGVPTRVLPGVNVEFRLVPMLGDKALSGSFAEVVEQVEDESVTCETECRWEAPEDGGEVLLRSSYDPKFRATISTYAPDDITDVIVQTVAQPRVLGPGQVLDVSAHVALRGKMPCHNTVVQVKTLTPRICRGPQDEAEWSGGPFGFSLKGLADGTCKLGLGAEGAADYPGEASLPLTVLSEFTIDHVDSPEQECSTEGVSTCARDFRHMLTCKKGVWVQGKSCEKRVCELHMRGEGGCKRDEGCPYCR